MFIILFPSFFDTWERVRVFNSKQTLTYVASCPLLPLFFSSPIHVCTKKRCTIKLTAEKRTQNADGNKEMEVEFYLQHPQEPNFICQNLHGGQQSHQGPSLQGLTATRDRHF